MKNVLLLFALLFITFQALSQETDNKTLNEIINRVADTVEGDAGSWRFAIENRLMVCITDENHNRMRIISPIMEVSKLTQEQIVNSLVANFHTALDVKYAISDEVLWAVFIHPLKELSPSQFEDAISQVYYASETFGSIYSSTNLVFPGKSTTEEPQNENVKTVVLQKG